MDRRRVTAGLVGGCAVLAVGGCAATPGPAGSTASRFDAAVGRSAWSTACAMLAPVTRDDLEQSAGTPCADALAQVSLEPAGPVVRVEVFGTMAQNWQSEFLAVGSMAVLTIYLRARGSPESKPVGASHETTGVEG